MTHLFVPRWPDGRRLEMQVSDEDWAKIRLRELDWHAVVTDATSGRKYLVRGAQCSIPNCYCDALVEGEVQ